MVISNLTKILKMRYWGNSGAYSPNVQIVWNWEAFYVKISIKSGFENNGALLKTLQIKLEIFRGHCFRRTVIN